MGTGAITDYIDIAQLVLYAFWLFFFGLVFYLHRENMREGYPLVTEVPGRTGFELVAPPPPKTFRLHDGRSVTVPRPEKPSTERARPADGWPGAPIVPEGDPLSSGAGPGAVSDREDEPERTFEGHDMIVPLRVETTFSIAPGDPDPRGMTVMAADGQAAGNVVDVWVDRGEPQIRYLEVATGANGAGRQVLLPIHFARIHGRERTVSVRALLAHQFGGVPALRNPDCVTKLEEERITAYFAAGTLYAEPHRQEPWL